MSRRRTSAVSVAAAAAYGEDIGRLDESGSGVDCPAETFRWLERIARAWPRRLDGPVDWPTRRPLLPTLLVGTVLLKCTAVAPLGPFGSWPSPWFPLGQLYAICLVAAVFALVGGALWVGGYRDRRALYLGALYLVVADAFAQTPVALFLTTTARDALTPAVRSLALLPVDAFLPTLLARFVHDFPRTLVLATPQRLLRALWPVTLGMSIALFVANLLPDGMSAAPWPVVRLANRWDAGGHYWATLFALCVPHLILGLWKVPSAPESERRRARFFMWGVALGAGPMLATGLLAATGEAQRRYLFVENRLLAGGVVYAFLLVMPLLTAYAVRAHRVLEVRRVAATAVRFLFRQDVLLAIGMVPLIGVARFAYLHRNDTLATIAVQWGGIWLCSLGASGLVWLLVRRPAGILLDRLLGRADRDAVRCVSRLAAAGREASDVRDLARLLHRAADEALRPRNVVVAVRTADGTMFGPASGWSRPLKADSALASLLQANPEPFKVDLEAPGGIARLLPEEDRQWLADWDACVLVALPGRRGSLRGFVALGERRGEWPYSRRDLELVQALTECVGGLLDRWGAVSVEPGQRVGPGLDGDEAAWECAECRVVRAPAEGPCACGGQMFRAPLPKVLQDKFRIDARIGTGGMGVVYRAIDLGLDRLVALKTLPRLSPEASLRLRREAQTMAAVSHPNLAIVFGVERWCGVPVIVSELLTGGTLDDRLRATRLSLRDAVDAAWVLADTLSHLHQAGILHRDLKPSNIGFQRDGTVKLLDFGLSEIVAGSVDPVGIWPDDQERAGPSRSDRTAAAADGVHTTGLLTWDTGHAWSGRRAISRRKRHAARWSEWRRTCGAWGSSSSRCSADTILSPAERRRRRSGVSRRPSARRTSGRGCRRALIPCAASSRGHCLPIQEAAEERGLHAAEPRIHPGGTAVADSRSGRGARRGGRNRPARRVATSGRTV